MSFSEYIPAGGWIRHRRRARLAERLRASLGVLCALALLILPEVIQ